MIKHVLYWLFSISRATFKNFDWQGSNLIGYASWFFSDFPCIFLTQELSVWSRAAGTRCEALLQVVKSKKSICIRQPDLNFLPNLINCPQFSEFWKVLREGVVSNFINLA